MKKKKFTVTPEDSDIIEYIPERQSFKSALLKAKNEYSYLGLSGLLCAGIVLLIYMIVTGGLYPIGNGTPLILDLNSQYVYFFSALRSAVFGDGELLYSFSRSLGGEFLGIYAYYLASPLSYLACLFPADRMQEFSMFLMMLKTALCGITMGYYLHKHSEKFNKLTIVAFSMLYALCGYCVVYQTNTMWIDAVIWLPLLTLGIESLVKYGKYKLFVISLTLTIASNYYIGYMCCVFVLIYFFYYMFAHKDNLVNNPYEEKKHFVKSLIRIAIFSAIAILIAAVIICSAYYSLGFGKNEFSDPNYDITTRISFFDVLFKFFPGSYDTVRPTNFSADEIGTGGFPFVYCGLITLLLMPVYFASKRFSVREKTGSAIFVGFFILSFIISTLDIMWHGFQEPQWLNNRYSFMLCFFMVVLAFKAFENIDDSTVKNSIIISALFFGGFAIVIQKMAPTLTEEIQGVNSSFKLGNFEFALFAIIMIAIYLLIIAVIRNSSNTSAVSAVLLIVISVELLLNGVSNTADFGDDVVFSTYSKYDQFQNIMNPITEVVKKNDDSFYRWEKTAYRKPNDNMQFDIRGLANSTSTLNASTIQLLHNMGYAARAQWSIYLGGTPVNDSLFGLKYIITDRDFSEFYGEPLYDAEDFAKHEGISVEELEKLTLADNSGSENYAKKSAADFVVYKNPYALSIAYAASDKVVDFNMKKYNTYVYEDNKSYEELYNNGGYTNPFECTNALITAILGEDEIVEIYKPAKQVAVNYSEGVKYRVSYGRLDDSIIHHVYEGKGGKVTFDYDVPEDTTLYMYLPAYYTRQVKISATLPIADGTNNFGSNVSTNPTLRIVELGSFGAEELISGKDHNYQLKVETDSDGQFYVQDQESYIYYVDTELLAEVMQKLQKNQLIIHDYSESSFEGAITTDNDNQLILTTIPYDEGWQVTVDGKRVDIIDAVDATPGVDGGGALMAFKIDSAGKHTVSMVYRPKIVVVGAVVSVCALAIFISLIVFERKLQKLSIYRRIFCIEDNSVKEEPQKQKLKSKFGNQNNRKE